MQELSRATVLCSLHYSQSLISLGLVLRGKQRHRGDILRFSAACRAFVAGFALLVQRSGRTRASWDCCQPPQCAAGAGGGRQGLPVSKPSRGTVMPHFPEKQ